MIPFIQNIQNREIYGDRKQMSCFQGLEGGGDGECLMGVGSLGGDENIIDLDDTDGCPAL